MFAVQPAASGLIPGAAAARGARMGGPRGVRGPA